MIGNAPKGGTTSIVSRPAPWAHGNLVSLTNQAGVLGMTSGCFQLLILPVAAGFAYEPLIISTHAARQDTNSSLETVQIA